MLYEMIGGKKYIMASIYELIDGKKYYWSTGGWGYAIIKISYNADDQVATVTDPKGNLFHAPDKSGLWMFNATENGTYTIHYPGADDQTVNITEKGQIVTIMMDTQNYNSQIVFMGNLVKDSSVSNLYKSPYINIGFKQNFNKYDNYNNIYKYHYNFSYDFTKYSIVYGYYNFESTTGAYYGVNHTLLLGYGLGDSGSYGDPWSLGNAVNKQIATHYYNVNSTSSKIPKQNIYAYTKTTNFVGINAPLVVKTAGTYSYYGSDNQYYRMTSYINNNGVGCQANLYGTGAVDADLRIDLFGMVFSKPDNIHIFANDKYGTTISEIINNSASLLANVDDLKLMVKKLTGDFMIEALSSKTFKAAYDASANKSIIQNNPVWSQYLIIMTKYTSKI